MTINPQNRLRNSFSEVVKRQAAELVELAREALEDSASRDALCFELERISGTASSLGLRQVERAARSALSAGDDESLLQRIDQLAEICRALEGISPLFRPIIVTGLAGVKADDLAVDLRAAADVDEALGIAEAEDPGAFVVPHDRLDRLRERLSGPLRAVPIFVVGPAGDLQRRLRAVSMGAAGYLGAPARLDRVLDYVRMRCGAQDEPARRVLLVEADPVVGAQVADLLSGPDCDTVRIPDLEGVLAALDRHRPDLVLLSTEAPALSPGGLDPAAITRMIQSHDVHGSVAVLLLAEKEQLQRLSLVAGADDILLKPADPQVLRTRVMDRLRRQRQLDGERVVDRLTGVLSRRAMLRAADREIGLCRRTGQLLSVVLFDVDSMGDLNNRLGPAVGDAVLAGLARILTRTFRETDILGRVGGDSFGALLPACAAADAKRRVELMREGLAALGAEQGCAELEISVGIADTTVDISDVMARADRALLQARGDGGGRTVLYSSDI